VPNATVTIANPITGYKRNRIRGPRRLVPTSTMFRPTAISWAVSATGLHAGIASFDCATAVPIALKIPLAISSATETVTVTTKRV